MTDEPDASSGNRWEPLFSPDTARESDAVTSTPRSGSGVTPRRARLAGTAALLVLGGGTAGYLVSHAATGHAPGSGSDGHDRPRPGLGGPAQPLPDGGDHGGSPAGSDDGGDDSARDTAYTAPPQDIS